MHIRVSHDKIYSCDLSRAVLHVSQGVNLSSRPFWLVFALVAAVFRSSTCSTTAYHSIF